MIFTPELQAAFIALVIAILTAVASWIKSHADKAEKETADKLKDAITPIADPLTKISDGAENLESMKISLESIARDIHDMAVQGRLFNKSNP